MKTEAELKEALLEEGNFDMSGLAWRSLVQPRQSLTFFVSGVKSMLVDRLSQYYTAEEEASFLRYPLGSSKSDYLL